MDRVAKEKVVQKLHDKFKISKAIILTEFKGMNVEKTTDLRKKLREKEAQYCVVKNTLAKVASNGTIVESVKNKFVGPTGVIFSNDPVGVAKIITSFVKDHPEISLKIGVIEGQIYNPDEINKIATLPDKEVLYSKVIGILKSTPTKFIMTLESLPKKLICILGAYKEKKEKGE